MDRLMCQFLVAKNRSGRLNQSNGSLNGYKIDPLVCLYAGIGRMTASQEVVSSNPPRQLRILAKPVFRC